jgi:hypothetical protein
MRSRSAALEMGKNGSAGREAKGRATARAYSGTASSMMVTGTSSVPEVPAARRGFLAARERGMAAARVWEVCWVGLRRGLSMVWPERRHGWRDCWTYRVASGDENGKWPELQRIF